MRVALFVPCYVDQLRPQIGFATLDLLTAAGFEVDFQEEVVCCGQPFLTAGETKRAAALGARFVDAFQNVEAIVTPSGSCAATLRRHLEPLVAAPAAAAVAAKTFELCEFLTKEAACPPLSRPFPHRVGLHASCHGLRELGLGTPTETRAAPRIDPARELLSQIPELEITSLDRRDECCGFGGTFSVEEAAVSARMGLDRLEDHGRGGAEIVTSTDDSCLLHLEGLSRRRTLPFEIFHIAEILAASALGHDLRASAEPR